MTGAPTLLVAAGAAPSKLTLKALSQAASRVIAVDGGLSHLRSINRFPDMVVGDLDSVDADDLDWAKGGGAEVVHLSGQEESDLAKALFLCSENSWGEVHVTGIEGGRLDHQLGSFAALVNAPSDLSVQATLVDGSIARITVEETRIFDYSGLFSLFSPTPATVSLTGAEWELSEELVEFSTRGLSNRATGKLSATVHSGAPILLLFNES